MRRVGELEGVGSHVPATRARVAPGESMSDLAVTAATSALAAGNGAGVDLVLLVTGAPSRGRPSAALEVARVLGLGSVTAFDMPAVGSGFVYGLAVVDGMIAAGKVRRVLMIGVDVFATAFDPAAASLFGDGAGAVVLRAGAADEPGARLRPWQPLSSAGRAAAA
jgi:3-oxoacyl-[acyl-carrier-protein] synthase III